MRWVRCCPGLQLYCVVFLWLMVGVFFYSGTRYLGPMLLYLASVFGGYIIMKAIWRFPRLQTWDGKGLPGKGLRKFLPITVFILTPVLMLGHYNSMGFFPLSEVLASRNPIDFALVRQSIITGVSPFWHYLASFLCRAVLPFFLVYYYVTRQKAKWLFWLAISTIYCLSLLQKSYVVILFVPILVLLFYRRQWKKACIVAIIPIVGVSFLFVATSGIANYWHRLSPSAIINSVGEAAEKRQSSAEQAVVKIITPSGLQPMAVEGNKFFRTSFSRGASFVVIEYDLGEPVAITAAGIKDILFSGGKATAAIEYSVDGVNYYQYGSPLLINDNEKTFLRNNPVMARYLRVQIQKFAWNGYVQFSDFAVVYPAGATRYNNSAGNWLQTAPEEPSFPERLAQMAENGFEWFLRLPLAERIVLSPGRGVVIWFNTFPEKIPFTNGDGYRVGAMVRGIPYTNLDRMVYDHEHPDMAAQGILGTENAASFMTDYANFGYPGLIFSGILLGFILFLIESIFSVDRAFLLALNFYPLFILSSTTLSSTLISGGWGLTIVLYMLLLKPGIDSDSSDPHTGWLL